MSNEAFKIRLKALRKNSKKRQQDMSELLKIKRSTYGAYETGAITPPMEKIKMLADYFNVSVDYLIGKDIDTKSDDFIDLMDNLKQVAELLKSGQDLRYDGDELDDKSRADLLNSFENFMKYADLLNSMNHREQ